MLLLLVYNHEKLKPHLILSSDFIITTCLVLVVLQPDSPFVQTKLADHRPVVVVVVIVLGHVLVIIIITFLLLLVVLQRSPPCADQTGWP